ncbi:hypothetical protein HanRHA438_Chr04g0199561 [Helianthus annuus]|uniref:Uncharacterized protein n=1 Tax=Helianthus annuus TaxID=4232 RepID=A0A9K3NTL6_HELAN|nr:hypothetical protein HanXRQr2_Chr04g0189661 [Helianthus annuus]KAJ0598747.1 hypothetical protein HanHA89_Chr04g0169091 [Helianthus annuus]KAJ0763003.1 hypothetical protein HanOQP8_Chr04g0167411 [Helianthus annuus]KAJ0766796.1 hypothetical protein HanLR1_Chr03g0081711 [Helianthus annuus]KAJ0928948.1 hypothetical protein HanRHA438_Chr04g0199561 [Helianthus annuus]
MNNNIAYLNGPNNASKKVGDFRVCGALLTGNVLENQCILRKQGYCF